MSHTDEKMTEMVDRFKKLCEIVELPSFPYGSEAYESRIETWATKIADEVDMTITKSANFCAMWTRLLDIHNISSDMI